VQPNVGATSAPDWRDTRAASAWRAVGVATAQAGL
jgi:hypothetical protein